jgi:hypothetical protein
MFWKKGFSSLTGILPFVSKWQFFLSSPCDPSIPAMILHSLLNQGLNVHIPDFSLNPSPVQLHPCSSTKVGPWNLFNTWASKKESS